MKNKLRLSLLAGVLLAAIPALAQQAPAPDLPKFPTPAPAVDAELIEANNRGVGFMGQFEFQKAIDVFEKVAEKWPTEQVRTNLAIAYLNRQQEGDSQRAMKILEEVLSKRQGFLAARYCKGILLLNAGKPGEALKEFQWVAEQDAAANKCPGQVFLIIRL